MAGPTAPRRVASGRWAGGWRAGSGRAGGASLLRRQVVLVLLAVLPAVAVLIYDQVELRRVSKADIVTDAARLLDLVEAEQISVVESVQQVLTLLAQTPPVREQDTASCQDLMSRVAGRLPSWQTINATDEDGTVFCSSSPAWIGVNIRDRSYIARARTGGGFVIGDFTIGRATGEPLLPFALPYRNPAQGKSGFVTSTLTLAWLSELVRGMPLPAGTTLTLADRNGVVLARLPHSGDAVGQPMPPDYMRFLRRAANGVAQVDDAEGVERILAYSPATSGTDGLFLALALDQDAALGPLDRTAWVGAVVIGLCLSAALLAARIGGRRLIQQPVAALADAAARWQRGDYAARADLRHAPAEIRVLGEAFDRMAAAVEDQMREVREREELHRVLASATREGILIHDGRQVIEANEVFLHLTGRTADDLIGRDPFDFIAPAFRPVVAERMRAGSTEPYEVVGLRKDGAAIPVELSGKQTVFHGRSVRVGVVRDLTAQKESERQLRNERARLAAVFENAVDGMVIADERGVIETVNPAARRMFGYAEGELDGRRLETLMPEPYAGEHAGYMHNYLTTGQARIIGTGREVAGKREDGSVFPLELGVGEFRVDVQRRFIGTLRDLTDRKRVEEQLRHSQRLDAIGRLTGGVAHDFNNLLLVVVTNLDLLADMLPPGTPEAGFAEEARIAALRGGELTQRLLAFAREQPLRPQVFDLNARIAEVMPLLRRAIGGGVTIEAELATDLWPTLADPTQVDDALINLAINARDAMPEGGRVLVETRNEHLDADYAARNADVAPGDYVLLSVADTGTGMTPEVLARAMEPFFTTKEVGRGSGLGLSQIYGFARQSGGHIALSSAPGRGTTARLYLPRAATAERPAPKAGDPASLPPGRESILVVEDDEDARRTVVTVLTSLGYRIREAANGPAGLRELAAHPDIDLLFTDVAMPEGMTGHDLAREARRLRPDLPILLTTGYSGPAARDGRRDPDLPSLDLPSLGKPYGVGQLATAIRGALDGGAGRPATSGPGRSGPDRDAPEAS